MATAADVPGYGRDMHRVRTQAAGLALTACLGLCVAGCGVPSGWTGGGLPASSAPSRTTVSTASSASAGTASTSPSVTPSPTTVQGLCAAALPGRTLLGWGVGTVGDFRDYNYGPPNHKPPLAKAFPGAAADVRGAWCATRAAKQATAWWAVVWQRAPRRAITIVGPGEGTHLGEISGPPAVP